jgi:sulfate adenylyltransferase
VRRSELHVETTLHQQGRRHRENEVRNQPVHIPEEKSDARGGVRNPNQFPRELGFSREDRDTNVTRVGYVASEITKHGGIAICALIAPYDGARKLVRSMVSATGGFVQVHVATALDVCERRDRKGLYAIARARLAKGEKAFFTGIDDPYEVPSDAELTIDAGAVTAEQAADKIMDLLMSEGYLA